MLEKNKFGKHKNTENSSLTKFNDFKFIANKFPIANYINNINNTKYFNVSNLLTNANYYILKPKGRKSYLWFTYYKKDLLCLLLFINNKNLEDESNEFYKFNINYDNTLCYNNVLLVGTYFYKYNLKNVYFNSNSNSNKSAKINTMHHYFILDNVVNFNMFNNVLTTYSSNNFTFKLNICKNVLQYIVNSYFNVYLVSNYFNIYLGIILDNYDEIFKLIYKLDYEIYCISCYNNNKYLGNFIITNELLNNNEKNYGYNFRVTACINQDIYNLFILENNKETFYDYALIDSYKTSVFMNSLFRKIKENKNLDLLEESDCEEEFENTSLEKYVNLNKSYIIECIYNKKFKKWIPKNLAKNNYIIDKNKINLIIHKNKIYL
jgi:hypothetical protein